MASSRRDFIKKAALLGAGTVLFTNDIFPKPTHKLFRKSEGKMSLTFYPYNLQLNHTFTIANYSRTTTPVVLVEIAYDGLTGYGEASLPQYLGETQESVCNFLKKVDLSQFSSPFLLEDILTYIDGLAEKNTAAKASVDIALHDLIGKITQQPLYRLLGLNPEKTPATSFTIGIDKKEVVQQKTLEAAPYSILKVKVGRDTDKMLIETIRSITNKPLYVDANQGWKDKQEALDKIFWLKEQGVVLVEQPMAKTDLESHAWLTERSPLPIIADESVQRLTDIKPLVGAFSGINIKLMKCTGLREAWKMIQVARANNMSVMLGCMTETSCAISAAAQISPAIDWADLDGNLLIGNDCFNGVTIKQGKITLSDNYGIGVTKR
ncbi:MAG: dipeptide epimerase [Paludibacteraceae bacterium]|jgi:L-Ala-D/L-Glu epimerase|nr:dipeptide epimerase [Paludibacteraceae bacterium]